MKNHLSFKSPGPLARLPRWSRALAAAAAAICATSISAHAQLLAWDFTGENSVATSLAEQKDANLSASTGTLTRGPNAPASTGNNSFRTTGFQNDGISTSNGDYFQATLSAAEGYAVSLSTINARVAGTSTFRASPGASNQFAYSLNGVTFTLIGSPAIRTTDGDLPEISVAGISDLQNVPASTTVTIRFYASGQTATGGWGFNSTSAGQYGLAFGGTVAEAGPVVDETPPVISLLTPANNAVDVEPPSELTAVFSEPVQAGTGDILLKKTADDSIVPSSFIIDGSTLTITPTSALDMDTGYYVIIDEGAVTDLADNAFAGITDNTGWTFTTVAADETPPLAIAFSPTNGSTVNPPGSLSITFDEEVQEAFFGDTYFVTVRNSDGSEFARIDTGFFEANVTFSGTVATIALPFDLDWEYGASYYVEVDAGAFEDLAGNEFAGITGNTTWSFSTPNVPDLAGVPYTQTFSSYTSAATLPLGWSAKGAIGYLAGYEGDWGTISQGGFRGNASVFGYHHTSQSQTSGIPLEQILTLRNMTGAEITDLTVTYKGRVTVLANTRIPAYTVTVAGTTASDLSYSTSEPDNSQRNASVGGLSIAEGATFQIKWISNYPSGSGSARQIGISDVFVSAESSLFAPVVQGMSVPPISISSSGATVQAEVSSDGGATLSARGFVYSQTADNALPELGGTGVSSFTDGAPAVGAFSTTLSGLSAATGYTVRAYATNSVGTSYSSAVSFTTLATPPTLVTSYTQQFANYDGTNPLGWTALSSGGVQAYIGDWGTGTAGGFRGGNSAPGVLGYQHTGTTGVLTVTLRLLNGTGAPITTLNVGYLGRVARVSEGRSPKWEVSVAGSAPVAALEYETLGGVDAAKFTEVSGLNIADGAEFSITWKSELGTGSGSNRQIGIADVYVGLEPPAAGNTYTDWANTNIGGQGPGEDFDGDGVPNGIEYFMGTNPTAFTATPGIVAGKVTWPRAADTTIASFKVEVSTNLINWENATDNYDANLDTSNASEVVFTMPSAPTKLFVRLSVDP